MNLDGLLSCAASASCLVIQGTNGLIVGMLLFLVATGLTIIFGVLRVINFAHGSFYMLGAYGAYTILNLTGSYLVAVLGAALWAGLLGMLFERVLISRIYGSNVLLQLLVCYGSVLMIDDVVRFIYGAEYLSMGTPAIFARPPVMILGGPVPPFYLFLTAVAGGTGLLLWFVLRFTMVGKQVRAAAANPMMLSSLGVNTNALRMMVFGAGCLLAGIAGALAAPVRALQPDMGLAILIEAFVVTVIGGMASVVGALVASLIFGFSRVFGTLGFPLFTDGLTFFVMILVLLFKPQGLFSAEGR